MLKDGQAAVLYRTCLCICINGSVLEKMSLRYIIIYIKVIKIIHV